MSGVAAAVAQRHSIRSFQDGPVDSDLVRAIVRQAARAPSGGNLQPWLVHLIEGERLDALKKLMRQRRQAMPAGEPMAHSFYPDPLPSLFNERRVRNGALLYSALGIDRADQAARAAWIDENFQFFGAPLGLFFFMPAAFGRYQWLDLGIFLQTVMLLLREAGLDSCPQADWAMHAGTVKDFIAAPADLELVCGMAVGHADPEAPINRVATARDDPFAIFDTPPNRLPEETR